MGCNKVYYTKCDELDFHIFSDILKYNLILMKNKHEIMTGEYYIQVNYYELTTSNICNQDDTHTYTEWITYPLSGVSFMKKMKNYGHGP